MNKKPIVILFSMMLYASVFSFPVNLELNEDLAPPSASGNSKTQKTSLVPKGNGRNDLGAVTTTVRTPPPPSSKKGKKTLVEEDDFIETGENEYLAPPSSNGNGVRPPPRIPMPKPMGAHEGNGGKGSIPVKVGISESNIGIGVTNNVGHNMKNLIDDDEFDNGEMMDLAPPSSNGNGVRPPPRIPMPKPMGAHKGKGTIPDKVGISESNVGIGAVNPVGHNVKNLIDDEEFDGMEDEDISEEDDLALT